MDRNKGLSSYTKPSEAEIIFSLNISELNSRGNWSPRGENKLPNFLFFYNLDNVAILILSQALADISPFNL